MPTIYNKTDPGAPALGTSSTGAREAFKTVLKACLVYGYDGKPAAGWTLAAEDTYHLILCNAKQTGYICFTFYSGHDFVRVTLAATFTGVANDVITGAGVKTGLAANNASPQWLRVANLTYTAQYSWAVVADGDSVLMTWYHYSGTNGTDYINMTAPNFPGFSLAFGEDSAGNFIALGGQNTSSYSSAYNYIGSTGFTSLRDPATGFLVDTGSLSVRVGSLGIGTDSYEAFAYQVVYPTYQVDLVRVPWFTPGGEAGYIRGFAYHPTAIGYLNYALRAVGRGAAVTDISISNAANPFELAAGLSVFPLKEYQARPGMYGTDDARFW